MSMLERCVSSRVLRLGLVALAVAGAILLFFGSPEQFPIAYRLDVDVYRTGAQVFLNGGDLYGSLPELTHGVDLPFTYPPIAAGLFTVLTVMPLWLGSALLTLTSIACVAVVVRIVLAQTCDRSNAQSWWLVATALAVGLWFGPIRETLVKGQINALLMALVAVGAILGRRRWWGGTLIGLAVAIKLTPAVFLLLLVLRRDWRGTAMTVASFTVFTGIGHLLMPKNSLEYWTHTLTDTGRIGGVGYAGNQSINAVLYRLGLEGSPRTLVWFTVAIGVGLLIAWVTGRLLAYGHDTAATITVGFAALFCSPVSWSHHWVWSLPLAVLMLVWAARPESQTRRWLWLAVSGSFVFVSTPQWWFPHDDDVELQWTALQQLVGSSYLIWSLTALIVIGVSAHRLGRPDHNSFESPSVLLPALFLHRVSGTTKS